MRILLVYPKYPETFWSFKHALKFVGKKAAFPPLGLLTVASLLPEKWKKKLVDMNIQKLEDEDLKWADMVFITAMIVQKESVKEIIKRSKKLGKRIVAGGPLFTTGFREFIEDIDHFVLGEAENTLSLFLKDFKNGCLKQIYTPNEWPDIKKTPIPLWALIDMRKYASMSIQYSRGCPFNCEFCDIIILNGHTPRTKTKEQILVELETLYQKGWRDNVFFVDDNFIGNKEKLKKEILPAMIKWMEEKKHPFSFNTEVSINLSDDEVLMKLMVKAGFNIVFVGIETPDENSLKECNKFQNRNRDLIACIRKIQNHGLQVQGGFIVGFDSDTPSIFSRQIRFIQQSGIVTAMVGLLNAPPKTRLYQRLKRAGRILRHPSGDNTDCSINFVPKMNQKILMNGYKRILKTIYTPKYYYQRVITFLKEYNPPKKIKRIRFHLYHLKAFSRSIWKLGIKEKERIYYWKLFFWCLFSRPRFLPLAITFSIYGFHFRKVFERYL